MDVICAPATAAGRGALAIVRFSGNGVASLRDMLCEPMFSGPWRNHHQRRVSFLDAGDVFDDGVAVFAKGPRTFTGEDTLEVTLHGNPLLVERCLQAAFKYGARLAGPGEFTRRAVIHGRLDLVRAEAIDQLIRAKSVPGIEVGRKAMDGAFHLLLDPVRATIVDVVSELEAWLDHGGDELAFSSDEEVKASLSQHRDNARELAATYTQGRRLVDGAVVALIGPANVGKSSLFNAILGRVAAVVHNTPGTTRDVVEGRTIINGMEVTLLDTAGERETADPIEAAGLALARERVQSADLLLLVGRVEDGIHPTLMSKASNTPHLPVLNGIDRMPNAKKPGFHCTAATTGEGIEELKTAISDYLVGADTHGRVLIASQRQQGLLLQIADLLQQALDDWEAGPAVVADGLVQAMEVMDSLTGADTREDVLDRVFSRFCIGK